MNLYSLNRLPAQDTQTLKAVWAEIRADSCPYHYNFHLHTTASDGQLPPEKLLEQAIAIGLKGLAITDHHTIEGFRVAHNYLQTLQEQYPRRQFPHLWIGTEITANLHNVEVHILGYGFDSEHRSMRNYLTGETPRGEKSLASNVINAIQQAGGLAVLAHPSRYHRSADQVIPQAALLGIDGVEVYYAYGNPKPWLPSPLESQQARELALAYSLSTTCGTDTHGSNLLQRI